MFQEKRENLNQIELRRERLSQVWQTIKELLLSFDPKSKNPESKKRMDNFKSDSCFAGIERSLKNLGEKASNILAREVGPQEIGWKKKNMLDQIKKICESDATPEQKIISIRYYIKDLASRLGIKLLDEQGKELFPL